MKKLIVILVIVLALLGFTLLGAWWWLTTTRSGAGWVLDRAAGFVPSLEWQSLEGGLRGGLVLRGVRLEEADTPVQVERLELAARVSLLPSPSVDVHWLRANGVRVTLSETEPPEPDAPPFEMPDISSPIPVRVRELQVRDIEIRLADPDSAPIVIERVELVGEYHERLALERLELVMPDSELDARGQWQLKHPFAGELTLNARHRIDETTEQAAQASISGRLAALDIDLDTQGPAELSGRVRLRGLPNELETSASLSGRFSDWPGLEYAAEDLSLDASGGPEAWQARVDVRLTGPDLPDNRIRARLSGSTETLDIESLLAELLDGEVEISGQAGLAPEPSAELELRLSGLDLTLLYPEWPQQARLDGRMDVVVNTDRIVLSDLALSAPPTSLKLTGSGHFEPEADRLALDLQWQELNWPPVTDDSEPLVSSQSGRVRVSGAISDWQLEIDTVLRTLGQPQASIEARARGDAEQARIERLAVDAGPLGRLRASGQVHWAPELRGAIRLELDEADPGQLVPELPGQLSSRLAVEFDGTTELALSIEDLSGELRGQPVSGSGEVSISEELPEAGQLELELGDNRLTIDSRDGRTWRWQIDARAMHQLWPELSGEAELSGRFNLFEQSLAARGQLRSSAVGDITLAQADLDLELGWSEPTRVELSLVAQDLDLNPWDRIDRLELGLTGSCRAHQLGLDLQGQRGNLELVGSGAMPDCLRGGETWTGELERLNLTETLAGNWELNQALAIEASPSRTRAGPGCLVESGTRQGRICLRSLAVADQGRLELGIEQVPMDLVLLPMDPTFNLTTPLSGEWEARWSEAAGLEHLVGYLALDEGAIRPLGLDQDLLVINSVRIDLTPDNDEFRLDLEAVFEGDSRLVSRAMLADLNDPGSAMIEAEARLNLPDIGVFNRLVAELDQLGGSLQADLLVRGPLRAPDIEGQARLADGLVVHAPIGLKISDIELELQGDNDQGRVSGRMLSGEGHLNINGQIRRGDERWRYEILAEGERFTLADVDWLRLQASPRIELSSSNGEMLLDGDVRIDHLRAGLPPGSEDRVAVSEDIRVVGENDLEEEVTGPPFRGRLGIDLGDDARLSAIGLQTQLAGGIELQWEPESAQPRGRGVIRLPSGSYRAYGQNLSISDGEIVFTGHPLDNPRLDIRAIRDIFGDPIVDEAGVYIRGNARNPEISLFTDPPTSEEKALAYVVTGADFDHAGGQGAVNVGFYLLPRLFVSYGIGLFETGNVLSGRWELSQRWGVRVVSGERDTGVDISFAVDR
jgi:translocation and assembly module TamB